jgi:hypothetical protein
MSVGPTLFLGVQRAACIASTAAEKSRARSSASVWRNAPSPQEICGRAASPQDLQNPRFEGYTCARSLLSTPNGKRIRETPESALMPAPATTIR